MNGEYRTVSGMDGWQHNLNASVEGLRPDWFKNLLEHGRSLQSKRYKKELQGFMLALYALRNNFTPGAFERSLPILRFEHQLNSVIADLTCPDYQYENYHTESIAQQNGRNS